MCSQAKVEKLFNWMVDVKELKNYFKHVNKVLDDDVNRHLFNLVSWLYSCVCLDTFTAPRYYTSFTIVPSTKSAPRIYFGRLAYQMKMVGVIWCNDSRGCVHEHHGCILWLYHGCNLYDCSHNAIICLRVYDGVVEWIWVCINMRTRFLHYFVTKRDIFKLYVRLDCRVGMHMIYIYIYIYIPARKGRLDLQQRLPQQAFPTFVVTSVWRLGRARLCEKLT